MQRYTLHVSWTAGKRLLVFIDDMNMPQVDTYGTQQPIALLKLLLEKGGMFDRGKDLNWKIFKDVQFIAAMGKVHAYIHCDTCIHVHILYYIHTVCIMYAHATKDLQPTASTVLKPGHPVSYSSVVYMFVRSFHLMGVFGCLSPPFFLFFC